MNDRPRLLHVASAASVLAVMTLDARPQPPEPPQPADPSATGRPETPALPHIRVDRDSRTIEIDGVVPIDAHAKASTKVYLEVIVCPPDTKEHEALVLTRAKPSDIHAALLLLGLEPGRPGSFAWVEGKLTSTQPSGPALDITLNYTDASGQPAEARPGDWVIVESTGKHLADSVEGGHFLFAGSRFDRTSEGDRYRADLDGTLIGLTTFGTESIAWSEVYSPQADLQEPDWIADRDRVPPYNTPVTIRIRPAPQPAPPESPPTQPEKTEPAKPEPPKPEPPEVE